MMNSITAAQHPHTFIYRGWDVSSFGNKYAHAILRGGMNILGENISNYHYEDLMKVYEEYQKIYDETVSRNEMYEKEQEKQWSWTRGR